MTLRNVGKDFSLEDQRQEINEIAADLYQAREGTYSFTGYKTFSTLATFTSGISSDSISLGNLTEGRVVIVGASGELIDTDKLTWDSTEEKLVVDGEIESTTFTSQGTVVGGQGANITGAECVFASATVSDLTDGRVVLAGTLGALEDSAKLTFDGTDLNVTGNVDITGQFKVSSSPFGLSHLHNVDIATTPDADQVLAYSNLTGNWRPLTVEVDEFDWSTESTIPNHIKNITSQMVSDWEDAHDWGDHSNSGYLTGESDTLGSVTARGATTTTAVTFEDVTINGTLTYTGSQNNTSQNAQIGTSSLTLNADLGRYTGSATGGTNTMTLSDTAGIVAGSSISVLNWTVGGPLTLTTGATVQSVDSSTEITLSESWGGSGTAQGDIYTPVQPTVNASIIAERSALADAIVRYNEGSNIWQFYDGTTWGHLSNYSLEGSTSTSNHVILKANPSVDDGNPVSFVELIGTSDLNIDWDGVNKKATFSLPDVAGITAGAYTNTNITVNDKGIITSIGNGQSGGGGSSSVSIAATPPGSPTAGDMWWSSIEGRLKIYYTDETPDSYWVDASPPLASQGGGGVTDGDKGDITVSLSGTTWSVDDDVIEEKHINAGGTPGANKVLVYDSNEATNWKWADQSGSGGGGLQNIVEDTTPQLGGNLDVNDKIIEFGDSSTANDNRLKLGSHDDIQLYHDGTTSILKEKKGQFHLLSEPNSGPGNIDVTSTTFNWISGSSTVVALTSNGITITGSLTAGGLTYPTTNGNANDVLTSNGSGGVSWSTPSVVSNLNDLTDVNAGSPGDGQVLKWQSSTSKWIAAADQTSTGGTGISLTDLSRTNATPNNPSKLEYDNTNGVFTYTPPDLTGYLQSESDTLDTVLGRGGSSPKVLTAGGDGSSSGVTLSDGEVSIRAGSGQQAKINLFCEVNNAHYVTVKAPPHSSFSGNVDFVLPANNGTNGYLLSTNGSGTTSWVAPPSGGVTDGDKGAIIVSQSGATWTLDAALTELSDVSVSSPSNGQVLKYNGTNWINDTDATGSTGPGGNHTQFQYNNNGSFAGNDLLLATNDTSYTGSGASLTLNGATGWGYGNVTWEPNIGCLALTRDSFLIFGSPDNAAYDMKASIGWASSVNRWIMNNPTDGMPWHFETRGEMVFKKQNSPETVHMTIDPDDGVEIKNQLDLTTATIIDKNGQAGTSGQILSSTATGIDWINAPGATTLDGLSDTNINTSNLANEQILQYNGSEWVNATVSLGGTDNYVNGGSWSSSNGNLNLTRSGGLSDVNISVSGLQSYFDTRYSTTTGASTLNDLNDTTIASPQTNQLLQWNGSKWVNATVSLGGTDTNNYVTDASWSSSTGQLTLTRGGTSSLSSVTANVSNLKTYLENNLNISGGIDPGTPNVSGATIRWNGSSWEWSRTALIDGGTSSNNTNLVVHNNTSGYGGMEIEANGQVLLKKAGTSYREGGHLQFEDHTFSNNQDTFAIDVYSDNGTFAECMIRIIDQYTGTQRFAVNHNGAWGIGHTNPDFGSTGEVMISRGSGQPPYWGNHANISGSSFATAAQGATADTANSEIDHIYSQLNAIGNDDSITTVAQLKTALLALVRN